MDKRTRKHPKINPEDGLENAILKVAADDYIEALKYKMEDPYDKEANKVIALLEKFFLSKWGQFLSNYRGELIIERCRQKVLKGGTTQ